MEDAFTEVKFHNAKIASELKRLCLMSEPSALEKKLKSERDVETKILRKACEALVSALSAFSEISDVVAKSPAETLAADLQRVFIANRLEQVLNTEAVEERLQVLLGTNENEERVSSLMYFKRLQIAERIETIAASSKDERT